jgi:subtilisin family serine protease
MFSVKSKGEQSSLVSGPIKEFNMKSRLSEANLHKVSPVLRGIAHTNNKVNYNRAAQIAILAYENVPGELLEDYPVEDLDASMAVPFEDVEDLKKEENIEPSSEGLVNVFIELRDRVVREETSTLQERIAEQDVPAPISKLEGRVARKENLIKATVALSEIQDLVEDEQISAVEVSQPVVFYTTEELTYKQEEPKRWSSDSEAVVREIQEAESNQPVLIGIIDVQGFDFTHPDFIKDGKTRFFRIWDQGGNDPDQAPEGFGYGVEITAKELNDAIETSKNLPADLWLPPYMLQPQSQMVISSHGTHVASIAAGNHGVCPQAFLAGVLLSLPAEDLDTRRSFYDSSRIADAVDYLFDLSSVLAEELDISSIPVSINISLGTNGHAHDASSPTSRWIDYSLTSPGRCVSVAAGNSGQEAPTSPEDIGFIMGRIHTSGQIPASGLTKDIGWVVVGNGIGDFSENELEFWYQPQDRIAVQLKPPGSLEWLPPVEPRHFIQNYNHEGTFISIFNELYAPANGLNYIAIHLSPLYAPEGRVAIRPGVWKVRLLGREIRDGSYHGWIERDDPRRLGADGTFEAWSFPSFFTSLSNVDNTSVSSLSCGQRIISVANLDEPNARINITSSQGPTRDERRKPDVTAPGTDILAANGFGPDSLRWVSMSGTSMASPYVAGVAGLMLSQNPKLTAAQILGIIHRSAKPLPGADFQWQNDAGFGQINLVKCVEEAQQMKADPKEVEL